MANINVKLRSGETVQMSHPDDWTQDQVETAIHESFPDESGGDGGEPTSPEPETEAKQPETTGFKGLKEDAMELLKHSLKGGLGFLRRAPGNIGELGSEMVKHPLSSPPHMAQQILAGLGSAVKDTAGLAPRLLKELGDKELLPSMFKNTPQMAEDLGVEKAFGLSATKKSDELLRAVPGLYGAGKLIAKPIRAGIEMAKAPSKEALFQRALGKGIEESGISHKLSVDDLAKFKDSLKTQFSGEFGERIGATDPTGQRVSIDVKQGKIEKQKAGTEIPEEQVGEIPAEPDTKAIIEESKNVAKKAREDAEHSLGVLDDPRGKAGVMIQKHIKNVKDSSSKLYNDSRQHYVDKKIKADNTKEIKEVTADLILLKDSDDLAPGYGSGTAEQKSLEAQLETLKSEQVNASDVFDLQRTLEKMGHDTRKKQYSGVSDIEFKRLGNLAERFDNNADKLARRLEAMGGKEVQGMIKEANKGWRTYKELQKNKVGKVALDKGEIPSRAMIDIANTQKGNEFLRALTDTYPELKKHMLAAHVGETSVNKLLKPTTLARKYLEALPEVEEKVNDLKEAIAGIKEGETKASSIKKGYDDLVKSMKEAATQQKVRQDSIKETESLKKQIKFHEDAIPKVEAKMKAADTKGLEHDKLKKELEDHKRELSNRQNRIKNIGEFLLKVKGATSITSMLGF